MVDMSTPNVPAIRRKEKKAVSLSLDQNLANNRVSCNDKANSKLGAE